MKTHHPRNYIVGGLLLVLVGFLWFLSQGQAGLKKSLSAKAQAPVPAKAEKFGLIPLHFERNKGQADESIDFIARGSGYALYLQPTKFTIALGHPAKSAPAMVHLGLVNADSSVKALGEEKLPGTVNYLRTGDLGRNLVGIETNGRVRYPQVYPGIDLVYYGNQKQVQYDFELAPYADPALVKWKIEGVKNTEIAVDGRLLLHTDLGTLSFEKPIIYQTKEGQKEFVEGGYRISAEREVGFEIASYDKSRPLVIDPTLSYSTILAGNGEDGIFGIAVDQSGAAYVTGYTFSTNLPITTGSAGAQQGDADVFVTKIAASGTSNVYSTYLGGGGFDQANAIAVSGSKAYVAGITYSPSTWKSGTNTLSADSMGDAFVCRLGTSGTNLEYTVLLSGSNEDSANAVAVDASGNAYVGGETYSSNYFTGTLLGSSDGFIAKINTSGTLQFTTRYKGTGNESVNAIAVDATGSIYIGGVTDSDDLTIAPATPLQNGPGGAQDGFVAKYGTDGRTLRYSTYLGGSDYDSVNGIAINSFGEVFVTGETRSTTPGFPVRNAYISENKGLSDGFVARINSTGNQLIYSTFLGGSSNDFGTGIGIDVYGNAYVTGYTESADFPTARPLENGQFSGTQDAFITVLNESGNTLRFSSLFGGSSVDRGWAIAVDKKSIPSGPNAYFAGETFSADFPLTPSTSGTDTAPPAGFVAKISDPTADLSVQISANPEPVIQGDILTYTVTVKNNGPGTASGVKVDQSLPSSVSFVSASPGVTGSSQLIASLGTLASGSSASYQVQVQADVAGSIQSSVVVKSESFDPLANNNTATATSQINFVKPVVTISATDPISSEEITTTALGIPISRQGTVTVSRTGSVGNALVVKYSVAGTADSGLDYEALSGAVTIPADKKSQTITIAPIQDSSVEGDETVVLSLNAPEAGAIYELGAVTSATVEIQDDDVATVTLSVIQDQALEGGTNGVFRLLRTGTATGTLAVKYTVGGTATNGIDYTGPVSTAVFPAGSNTTDVEVSAIDDGIFDPNETVSITLIADSREPKQYELGPVTTAQVIIQDIMPVASITQSNLERVVLENSGEPAKLTFNRTGPANADLVVYYTVTTLPAKYYKNITGKAMVGYDYTVVSPVLTDFVNPDKGIGFVTIPSGQSSVTVDLVPINDKIKEYNEIAVFTLGVPTGDKTYVINAAKKNGYLQIIDDDFRRR